ncbi:hypothetical protein Dimus_009576 [Dionaea muscipula]
MAGRELGFPKPSSSSLREQLARKTLRNVRLQGHTYVDLREDGKRYIFFCTLCLARCYSDAVLFDHLRGNLHKERYEAAKVTLIRPNPWPFDDGVLFFCNLDELASKDGNVNWNGGGQNTDNLAIVVHGKGSRAFTNGHACGDSFSEEPAIGSNGDDMGCYDGRYNLVIPGVIGREQVSDLRVRLTGYGRISALFDEKDGVSTGIRKIWCEWLGEGFCRDEVNNMMPAVASDFGFVTFVYYYDLGKQGLFEDIRSLLPPAENIEINRGRSKRKRKSFSDPEDVSNSLCNQCDSSTEDSLASSTETSRLLLGHLDDQLLQSRIISSKTLRRELRRQQRLASERMCDICQHKMLPGKDVATLVNMKTGRLACSSRNVHGAFHVYHTSCLIHWVLLCEVEMFGNPPATSKKRQRSRRKTKGNERGKELDAGKVPLKRNLKKKDTNNVKLAENISSVFCPDCQGTGMIIEGEELENPTIPLSEMLKYKIKLSDARRAWMKCPEELENCSTGLAFTSLADDVQAKTSPMKLLHIYRSEE